MGLMDQMKDAAKQAQDAAKKAGTQAQDAAQKAADKAKGASEKSDAEEADPPADDAADQGK